MNKSRDLCTLKIHIYGNITRAKKHVTFDENLPREFFNDIMTNLDNFNTVLDRVCQYNKQTKRYLYCAAVLKNQQVTRVLPQRAITTKLQQ